jgi:hypothetical protein
LQQGEGRIFWCNILSTWRQGIATKCLQGWAGPASVYSLNVIRDHRRMIRHHRQRTAPSRKIMDRLERPLHNWRHS